MKNIVFRAEPVGARSALLDGLYGTGATAGPGVGGAADIAKAKTCRPIPMYDLPLTEVLRGRGLDAAREIGIRYMLAGPTGEIERAAEVYMTGGGPNQGYQLASLSDSYTTALDEAMVVAEEHPRVGKSDATFELDVLQIPALQLFALWFRPNDPTRTPNQFVVVAPAPSDFREDTVLAEHQFLEQLLNLIKRQMRAAPLTPSKIEGPPPSGPPPRWAQGL